MKKKNVWLLMLVCLMTLVGCGQNKANTANTEKNDKEVATSQGKLDPEKPTNIRFYSYSLAYPTMKPGIEHLIKSFNDGVGKEKGVIVEGVENPLTGNKVQADIASGQEVDLIQQIFPTLDYAKENYKLRSYEDIFPKDELEEHFSAFSSNALSLGKIDDKTYGLAFTFSTPILYINSKLFEEAGLDPKNPPKTWDEVKQYSKQIKEKTGQDGFGLAPENGWVDQSLLYSKGASVMNDARTEATFASKNAVEAISVWKDIYQNGGASKGTDSELDEQFMAGKLGMRVQSSALLSGYRAASEKQGWELYGTQLPSFDNNPSIPVNSGSALAVRSEDPTKTAAIWEFIKYATGKEGYTIITEEIGYLPLRTDIVSDPKYLKDFIDKTPLMKTNLDQLERIKPTVIWPAKIATEANNIYKDALTQAISDENADVSETLKTAEDKINNLMK